MLICNVKWIFYLKFLKMQELLEYIHNNIPKLDTTFDKNISSFLKSRTLLKGDVLIVEGQVNKNLYFVNKGILRNFMLKDGKDISTWFFFESDFITTFDSFQLQIPSNETSIALTDCELFWITFDDLETLNNASHQWEKITRIFTIKFAIQLGDRLLMFQTMNAEEKYHHLAIKYPKIIQSIPNKYIASYLGITRETLSRIRAKKH
jgi:CRP/FNR family transcriptional regulator, anaerobic regulatory protein